jgi:hypothetical protein
MALLFNIHDIIIDLFKARGGSRGVGIEAIENDIQFFEIGYAFDEINKTPFSAVFGKQSDRLIFINTMRHSMGEWSIHKQYAQYLLK